MSEAKILILSRSSGERAFLGGLTQDLGEIFECSSLDRAISSAQSTRFHVVVADWTLADYSSLKGIFLPSTSFIIIGRDEKKVLEVLGGWPEEIYVGIQLLPLPPQDGDIFRRILKTAIEHSQLKTRTEAPPPPTVPTLPAEMNQEKIKEVHAEIKEIKNLINSSVLRELEKRIAFEIKYLWSQREKQKIESVLKKLYAASDVSSLLDIVYDIKDIVQAGGITFYILDQNEALGKYLKPLVWDDAILSHPEFAKYIAPLDSEEDFAAYVARNAAELSLADLSPAQKMAKRYAENLRRPLNSLLVIPILDDKDVIGILEVYNKEVKGKLSKLGFSREDQVTLRRLSEHISLAMTKLNLIQYDALTGLLRPDPFFERVVQKVNSQSKRRQEVGAYAMVMGDVDWFKNYNDRNGHEAGNRLLRELAGILKSSIREEDLICRYGGEEFLFFLTGVKNIEEAVLLTDRIRKNVEAHYFENEEFQPRKNLTMSFGVTLFSQTRNAIFVSVNKNDLKRIAIEADTALAEAKGKKLQESGLLEPGQAAKNKVCAFDREAKEKEKKPSGLRLSKEEFFQEKRIFERHFVSTLLLFKENGAFKVTKTINISLGGAKIYSDSQLPRDRTLDVYLLLEKKASPLRGDVVYSDKIGEDPPSYHSGLKFRDLSFADKKALENYLSTLGKRQTLN